MRLLCSTLILPAETQRPQSRENAASGKNMAKYSVLTLFFLVVGLIFAAPANVAAQNQQPAARENAENEEAVTKADRESIKISPRWAKRIALRRVPGRIVGWEVEKEDGRVQYEFKIVGKNGKRYEVEVDALTGEVIEAEPAD